MRPPGGPLLSPDGRYFWDGAEWRPSSELPPVVSGPPSAYAPQPQPQYYAAPAQVQQPMQPYYPAPQPAYPESPQYAPYPHQMPMAVGNGIATAAGVLGIIAVVLMFVPYADYGGIVLGALAVILGGVGISRANRLRGAGRGMAITGLVLGLIAIVVSVAFIAVIYTSLNSVNFSR